MFAYSYERSESLQSGSEEAAIDIENLSVKYRTTIERRPTMKAAILRLGRPSQDVKYIQAIEDLSLKVQPGEFLGVIGHNGAGKSTLLRTIAGILPPSKGRLTIRGTVTTLLSVGIGFNGELSGRENIRLGGLANGLSLDEINGKIEEIIEFSELGEFIEYPMKTYSNGMYSRLGFSVVTHVEPDILLIDEALSAGDAAFQTKAEKKIEGMMAKARVIILVSHGLETVKKMASTCLWLDHGETKGYGPPLEITEAYEAFVSWRIFKYWRKRN